MIEIGKRIKEIRTTRRLTQQKLADETGIDVTLISKYETGKKEIGLDNLKRICEALSTSLDYIIYGKGKPIKLYADPNSNIENIFPMFISPTEIEELKTEYDTLPVVLKQYIDEVEILFKTYNFPRLELKMEETRKEFVHVFNYHIRRHEYDLAFNHRYFEKDYSQMYIDDMWYDGSYDSDDEEYESDLERFYREFNEKQDKFFKEFFPNESD